LGLKTLAEENKVYKEEILGVLPEDLENWSEAREKLVEMQVLDFEFFDHFGLEFYFFLKPSS